MDQDVKGLLEDLGFGMEMHVKSDSSAANRINARRGAGRTRCIEVRELWVRGQLAKGELKIVKMNGEENAADGSAKHVDRQRRSSTWRQAAWCGGVADMS